MPKMNTPNSLTWLRKLALTRKIEVGAKAQPTAAPPSKISSSQISKPRGVIAQGVKLPRFLSPAGDRTDRRGADRVSAARLDLRNAFTPSQPITDPWLFVGRTELLTKLIRAVEDRRLHALIYGARGIGKTSLLHVLAGMAKDANYRVSYVTCGASATFSEMFRAVAASVPLLYHTAYGPKSPESERGDTLLDLTPPGEISPQLASELCASITGTRLLIVLDEFDRPSSSKFNRDVAEFIKNLSDRAVRVQLVVAGVAEDLQDLMNSNGIVQRNVVAIRVPRMTDEELTELIRRGEETSGVSFEPQAVAALCKTSAGMPYLGSLLSQQAALTALADGRLVVTLADVNAAVSETVEDIQARLPKRARTFLEDRARQSAGPLNAIANFAYLSGSTISQTRIRSMFTDGGLAERAVAEISALQSQGILVEADSATADGGLRFKDENELLFVWLLTVRDRLKSSIGTTPK